jgi:mannose-6-phosphate isomerase-like protein (cupin superfamily)
MVPATLSMRVFAAANALLSLLLLWLLLNLLPKIEEAAKDEPIRLPIAVVLLFVFAAVAVLAWRPVWGVRSPRGWAVATIPAVIFLVVFLQVMAPTLFVGRNFTEFIHAMLSLWAAAIAVASGLVASREASSARVLLSGDVRDTRIRILGAIVLAAIVGPTIFWIVRPKDGQGGGPGPGDASASATRPPGAGVMTEVLAQGSLPLPQGTLTVSALEIRQPGGNRVADMHNAGFVYVIEGEQQLTFDTKQQTVRAGGAVYVPPGATHEHLAVAPSPCRWLFIGARAANVADSDFKFGEQTVVYRSSELPSLPAGANTEVLVTFVLKPESESFRYKTGGVALFLVLAGEVLVDAGTGRSDLKAGQGTHLLSGTPFTLRNIAPSESRVIVFVLAPEGSVPMAQLP